jgi:hypothetical protein
MILAAYGATVVAIGLVPALRTRGLLKGGAAVQGVVVGAKLETHQARDGSTYYSYRPVVRFGAPGGRQVVFTSALGSPRSPPAGSVTR